MHPEAGLQLTHALNCIQADHRFKSADRQDSERQLIGKSGDGSVRLVVAGPRPLPFRHDRLLPDGQRASERKRPM